MWSFLSCKTLNSSFLWCTIFYDFTMIFLRVTPIFCIEFFASYLFAPKKACIVSSLFCTVFLTTMYRLAPYFRSLFTDFAIFFLRFFKDTDLRCRFFDTLSFGFAILTILPTIYSIILCFLSYLC